MDGFLWFFNMLGKSLKPWLHDQVLWCHPLPRESIDAREHPQIQRGAQQPAARPWGNSWSCRFWGKRCGEQDLFWFKQWKTTDFDWFGWIWTMQNQSFPEVSYNSSWTTTSWLQPPRARLGLAWVRWSTWHTWVKTSSRMVETLPVGRFQPMAIATPEKWTVIDCNVRLFYCGFTVLSFEGLL